MSRRLTAWRVSVEAHEVLGCSLAARSIEVEAINGVEARVLVVRRLHEEAGLRQWAPTLRRSYLRTSAASLEATGGGGPP